MKGTGFRDKLDKLIKKNYQKKSSMIIKYVYLYKQYKNFSNYEKLDKDYKKKIKKYWKRYHINICLKEFQFYNNKKAKKDSRYITKLIFHSKIEPFFNDSMLTMFASNKNYLDLLLKKASLPFTVIRNINGVLLDNDYNLVNENLIMDILKKENGELIYKPAVESGGGRGILFFKKNDIDLIKNIIYNEKDYVIQRVVKQHPEFNKFNESSINTVRVLSFLYEGDVHILYMVLRVGKEGMRVDNASGGGIQIVVKDDGRFSDYIVNINNEEIKDNIIKEKFVNKQMPFYDKIKNEVIKLHPLISVFGLVGWDITVDETGNPIVIEINLKDIGMTDKSQCINGPLFGDLTDSVLRHISRL